MSQSQDTEVSSIASLVAACRATFNSGTTLPLSWRKAQLNAIIAMVTENRSAIHAAVQADLGKPLFEADVHEVEMVLQETRHTLAHVSSWAAPQAAHTPLMYLPASTYIYHDPLGVALILTPWNFPFCAWAAVSPCLQALCCMQGSLSKHPLPLSHLSLAHRPWPELYCGSSGRWQCSGVQAL